MLYYDYAAALLLGIGHIYLFNLLTGNRAMPLGYITLLAILMIALLGIGVNLSGFAELNIIIILVFLMILGAMRKQAVRSQLVYFALTSIVLFTVIKNGLYTVALQLYFESPFNFYVGTQSAIHFATILLIVVSFYLFRNVIASTGLLLINSKLYVPSYFIVVICSILLLIINYPATAILAKINSQYGEQLYMIVLIIAMVLLFLITIYMYRSKEQLSVKHEQLRQEQLMEYVEKLEFMHDELSTFRHDYMNILLSMEESIRANDLQQIKKIYENTIAPTASIINHQQLELTKLSRIHIPELKSVLSVKIIEMLRNQLTIAVDIPQSIGELHIPTDQFIRVMTILIDNALEEARISNDKKVQIALFEANQNEFYFIVSNSTDSTIRHIEQFYTKHHTTKGEGRGYGLFSVQRIIHKHPNMTLTTVVDSNRFEQKIVVKKK